MLFIILFLITSVLSQNTSIKILNYEELEFGKILIIQCNFNNISVISSTDQILWMKNSKIISINNKIVKPFNEKKYYVKCIEVYTIIMIYYINIDDLESEYTCSFNNEKKTINININEQTFINIPKEEDIYINNSNLLINIHIKKIYPIPKCYYKINNKIFNIKNKNITKLNKYYYETFLKFENNFTECNKILIVKCILLNKEITIFNKKLQNCPTTEQLTTEQLTTEQLTTEIFKQYKSPNSQKQISNLFIILITIICLFCIIIFFTVIFIIIENKKKKQRKKNILYKETKFFNNFFINNI